MAVLASCCNTLLVGHAQPYRWESGNVFLLNIHGSLAHTGYMVERIVGILNKLRKLDYLIGELKTNRIIFVFRLKLPKCDCFTVKLKKKLRSCNLRMFFLGYFDLFTLWKTIECSNDPKEAILLDLFPYFPMNQKNFSPKLISLDNRNRSLQMIKNRSQNY